MSIIQIHDDDILWKLYNRYFQMAKVPVERPKSLCSYFWLAMFGALSYIPEKGTYWKVFVGILIASAVFLIPAFVYAQLEWCTLIGSFLLASDLFMGLMIGLMRLAEWSGTWPQWLQRTMPWFIGAWPVIGLGIAYYIDPETTTKITGKSVITIVFVLAGMAGIMLAVVGIIALLMMLLKPVVSLRFFQNVWAFIKACKQKVCPLVAAPESFKETKKDKIVEAIPIEG